MKMASFVQLAQFAIAALMRQPANTTGSCLCGDIRWLVKGKFLGCVLCHCSICRSVYGTAHASIGIVADKNFSWSRGQENICKVKFTSGGSRGFCGRCGTAVPHSDPDSSITMVQMGCLDGDPKIQPQLHLFAGSSAKWFQIPEDGLPRYDAYADWMPGTPNDSAFAESESGGCLCRTVRYQLSEKPRDYQRCDCSRCRKSTGSMFSAIGHIESSSFKWVTGIENVRKFESPNDAHQHSFCQSCGAFLPTLVGAKVHVPMGSLWEIT